jgi:hypothetical protein
MVSRPALRSVPQNKNIESVGLSFRLRRTQCNSSHRRFILSKPQEDRPALHAENSLSPGDQVKF